MRLPKHRKPTTPGEILRHEFVGPLNLSQAAFAQHLGWTTTKLNQILHGKRAVTPETALTLSDALGVSPDFWLNAQQACDLWEALQTHQSISRLPSLKEAS
jgi:addiction module HigA family antidote